MDEAMTFAGEEMGGGLILAGLLIGAGLLLVAIASVAERIRGSRRSKDRQPEGEPDLTTHP